MQHKKSLMVFAAGAAFLVLASFVLMSWDFRTPGPQQQTKYAPAPDTIPDKKVKSIEDAIEQLEKARIQLEESLNMEKIQREVEAGLKELDMAKIKQKIDESLREVDLAKIEKEMIASMRESSLSKEKIEKEMAEMKKELEKVKEIDMSRMEADLARARKELENIQPKIKKELEKARVDIEKAKKDLQETKGFIDDLERDGLISKKENYTIRHEKGQLIINGKTQPESVYKKYKSYLDKRKEFTIRKEADDFNIHSDDHIRRL